MTSVEDQSASDLTRVEMLKDVKKGSTFNLKELERCDVTNLMDRPIYLCDAQGTRDFCVFPPSEYEARLCAHKSESGSKYGLPLACPVGWDLYGIPKQGVDRGPMVFIVPADVGMYIRYSGFIWPNCAFIGPDLSAGSLAENTNIIRVKRFVLYQAPVEK